MTQQPRACVVALMIGELPNMTQLNEISTRIVERAVEWWSAGLSDLLVCESQPMTELALARGVPAVVVRTAIPEPKGHTTRWAAERVRAIPEAALGPVVLITHRLHGARAARIFRRLGVPATVDPVDVPFNSAERDWKLRSVLAFRAYNAVAYAYCFARGWLIPSRVRRA